MLFHLSGQNFEPINQKGFQISEDALYICTYCNTLYFLSLKKSNSPSSHRANLVARKLMSGTKVALESAELVVRDV